MFSSITCWSQTVLSVNKDNLYDHNQQHKHSQQTEDYQLNQHSQQTEECQLNQHSQQTEYFPLNLNYQQSRDSSQVCYTFGCHDNNVYSLDSLGNIQWRYETDSVVYATPYIIAAPVLACNAERASMSTSVPGFSLSKKQFVNVVCACTSVGNIYFLRASDGSCLATHHLPGEIFSSPVALGDRIVIGCRNNYVYSLQLILTIKQK